MRVNRLLAGAVVGVLTVATIGYGVWYLSPQTTSPEHKYQVAQTTWYCPMHPSVSQHEPGTCPICGMALVASASAGSLHEHGVKVDSATLQNLGVRLAAVKERLIGAPLRAYGNVVDDGVTVFSVRPRFEGWIRKLHVHSVGETVRRGQILYEIYSPDLMLQQRAYLNAIDRKNQLAQTLSVPSYEENKFLMDTFQQLAKERAELVEEEGISLESLRTMEDSRQVVEVVKIVAQRGGVVTQLSATEGSFVSPGTPFMTLSDASRAWVDVSLYPDQLNRVQIGNPVTVFEPSGENLTSTLNFVSPVAENNVVHVRAPLDLSHSTLRIGSYVGVSIRTAVHKGLVLPRSAIIYAAQGNRVMLSLGEGHFLPVPVETGAEEGDEVEILDGLKVGAKVAVNGQYLLDSAASMNAAAERMHSSP
ncbi:efflux RND transporter periplasmic adaptor subunit [Ferrovum sp.]|uniref:efflux RND transporter periplasmic adaptor subunit n=1 Tax=Ferrovum sp. TaxID=2609467 RepID=UPI003423B8DB